MDTDSRFLTIINRTTIARIPISAVEAAEQEGRKLVIYTSDSIYECYENLGRIAPLFDVDGYIRPMKTMIVNLNQVIEMSEGNVRFFSGRSFWLGRNSFRIAKQAFRSYIGEYPSLKQTKGGVALEENTDKLIVI